MDSSKKISEPAAFFALYQRYYNELYSYGYRIAHHEELTRDSIHDLFIQLWNKSLTELRDPKPYLFKSLRYIILDALRKSKNQGEFTEDQSPDAVLSKEDILINKEIEDQTGIKIKAAIASLTGRQKEVIYLKINDGLTYDEIADITGINNQSVRNLYSSALKELRNHMIPILMIGAILQL